MAEDNGRPFTLRDLQLHGTPEQVRAFEAGRLSMTEHDFERRLSSVEANQAEMKMSQAEMKSQLQAIASDAHATRVEQNAALKTIVEEVKTISREQSVESGRREVTAVSVAAALRQEDRAAGWVRWALPFIGAACLYLATQYVQDIAAPRDVDVTVQPAK